MNDRDPDFEGPLDYRDAVLRGRAVEIFAELESTLDSIIAGYYTPRHPLSTYLYLDLLASENCSFALRRDVFESIARRHGCFDDKRMQSVRRASRWRNFFAHATLEVHDYGNGDPTPKIGIRDAKTGKPITVAEAFDKFVADCKEAVAYARAVYDVCFPRTPFLTFGHIVEDPHPERHHPSLAAHMVDEDAGESQ